MPRQVRKMVRARHDPRPHPVCHQMDDVPGRRTRNGTSTALRRRGVDRGGDRTGSGERLQEEASRLHRNDQQDIGKRGPFRKENSGRLLTNVRPKGEITDMPASACAPRAGPTHEKARQAFACRAGFKTGSSSDQRIRKKRCARSASISTGLTLPSDSNEPLIEPETSRVAVPSQLS